MLFPTVDNDDDNNSRHNKVIFVETKRRRPRDK